MSKQDEPPSTAWTQPSPRKEMLAEVKALDPAARRARFLIEHGKPRHIDDEVIVTLMREAWRSGDPQADVYASELLRRVNKHVKAHVRKNPGWQRLGGGSEPAQADFCQEVVIAILEDADTPCYAELRFGSFVYRRCLDEAGKLYAKKRSAGQSFDEQEDVEAQAQDSDPVDSPAAEQSPEELLIALEQQLAETAKLEQVRLIMQSEHMPELPRIAFTFRFYADLKIESKDKSETTVTKLMGCTEKTASKYIKQAIAIIIERLNA